MSFLNSLINSVYNADNKTLTENGAIINENTGHTGVTAFNKLVRDSTHNVKTGKVLAKEINKANKNNLYSENNTELENTKYTMSLETHESINNVEKYYGSMIQEGIMRVTKNNNDTELLNDVFILPFYKRCFNKTIIDNGNKTNHTGEGERLLSFQMILELYKYFPNTVFDIIHLLPSYGSWNDLFKIWQLMNKRESQNTQLLESYINLKCYILYIVITNLHNDQYNYSNSNNVSLLAKWIPREGSSKDNTCNIQFNINNSKFKYSLFTALAILHNKPLNFAGSKEAFIDTIKSYLSKNYDIKTLNYYKMQFRKLISNLNKHIKTFEIYICSNNWSLADPKNLPSKALHKYKHAYLNEKTGMTPIYDKTGNRYPDNKDRVDARNKLIDFILSGKDINVSGLDPHEILNAYRKANSKFQKTIVLKQWEAKLDEVFNKFIQIENIDKNDTNALKNSRMCNLIPMMDISGSMMGLPMEVSIGLGLFICGLQKKCGVNQLAITFSEKPYALDLTNKTLDEQINYVYTNGGLTTNFEAAINLLLDAIKLSGHHKDLIVFTDGQFDHMNSINKFPSYSNWATCHQNILQKVASLNLDKAPNIIYWNLRANTPGVQTSANHPGVQLLQGYSPAILNFALYGGDYNEHEITIVDNNGNKKQIKVNSKTPYDTYRQALDQECFENIKTYIKKSNEGALSYI